MSLKEENEILKSLEVHDSMSRALETICDENTGQITRHQARNTYMSLLVQAELKIGQELPELRKLYWKTCSYF